MVDRQRQPRHRTKGRAGYCVLAGHATCERLLSPGADHDDSQMRADTAGDVFRFERPDGAVRAFGPLPPHEEIKSIEDWFA